MRVASRRKERQRNIFQATVRWTCIGPVELTSGSQDQHRPVRELRLIALGDISLGC